MDEIRLMPDSDLPEFVRIAADAYPGIGLATEDDRKKLVERLIKLNEDPRVNTHGYYRDDRLIAAIRLYDYTMTVRGIQMLAGGAGFLEVDLPFKKEGVARRIMEYYFAHYLEKKAAMAVLWPFRPDFYRKMGVGLGSRVSTYSLKPGHFPKGPTKEHVDWLSDKDLPDIVACYNRYARQTNGMIEESVDSLKAIYFGKRARKVVGCRRNGSIEGFMVFSFEKAGAKSFIDNNLVIAYLIYETREALSELMTFLHSQDDQFHRVLITTNDDFFYFLPHDPRNESRIVRESVNHESHVNSVGAMFRAIDTPRLFELLADANFNGVDLTLRIDLRDSFLPSNDGRYVVAFKQGRPTLVESDKADVAISLDIAEFSSLIMGAVDFKSLYAYSLADISNPVHVADVDRIFAVDHTPLCLTPF
jgi:predicted acetyltransferase